MYPWQNLDAQDLKSTWKKVKNKIEKAVEESTEKIIEEKNSNPSNNPKENQEPQNSLFDKNLLEFKSPDSKNYLSFKIQQFKDLPRFGELDTYEFRNKRVFNKKGSDESIKIIEKNKEIKNFYRLYSSIVNFKFMKSNFDEMDKTNLSPVSSGSNVNKSYYAQNFLLNFAQLNCTIEAKNQYLCNPEIGDCEATEFVVKREGGGYNTIKSGIGNNWGGNNSSSFSKQRNFSQFVNDHLEPLQQWSNSFWENGSQEVYLVVQLSSGIKDNNYDFEKQGYWVRLNLGLPSNPINSTINTNNFFSNYVPFHDFEKTRFKTFEEKLANRDYKSELLFKIDPKLAEQLTKESNGQLKGFAVYHLKISFSGESGKKIEGRMMEYLPIYTFNIESPIVEIYQDEGLTKKYGEISLK